MNTRVLEDDVAHTPTGGPSRMRYLDSLRGTLMLLGIVVHTGGRFGAHREAMAGGWEGWSALAGFIHLWRMPTFFLIAGFFAALVLSRQSVGRWWSRRLLRLGLPLVFGLLIVNSFLWPAKAYSRGRLAGSGAPEVWDEVVVPHIGQTAHLWFLVHLLILCTVLAALTWAVRRWGGRPHLRGAAARTMAKPWVVLGLLVPAALLGGWALHLDSRVQVDIVGVSASSALLPFTVCFLVGVMLGLAPWSLGPLVDRLAWWLALPALVLPLLLGLGPGLDTGTWGRAMAVVVSGLAWAFVLLAVFKRFGDRGGWPTRYLVDASLPVYLVHLPVIFAVAGLVTASGSGPVAGGLITMAGTVVISFALYELLNLTSPTRWLSTGRGERGASLRDVSFARRRGVRVQAEPPPAAASTSSGAASP